EGQPGRIGHHHGVQGPGARRSTGTQTTGPVPEAAATLRADDTGALAGRDHQLRLTRTIPEQG
ncbi:MAG: hypothetical protein Q8M66_01950, partial [Actinomycetota bacterium]|nr:hypothetical protein [Actinomycetota bacterium]